MAGVIIIEHKGKKIVFQDMRDSRDSSENIAVVEKAKEMIMKMPEKSVLLLTDVTNAHYDVKSADVLKQFSKEVTPYMKASAALGVVGIKRILFNTLLRLTGRHIEMFEDKDDALDYLAKHG